MSTQNPEQIVVEELESLWDEVIEGDVGLIQPGEAIVCLSPGALRALAAFWEEYAHVIRTEDRFSPAWNDLSGRYHGLIFRLDRFDFHRQKERLEELKTKGGVQ